MIISNLYTAIKHNNLPLHLLCLKAIYTLLLMWQDNGMNPIMAHLQLNLLLL